MATGDSETGLLTYSEYEALSQIPERRRVERTALVLTGLEKLQVLLEPDNVQETADRVRQLGPKQLKALSRSVQDLLDQLPSREVDDELVAHRPHPGLHTVVPVRPAPTIELELVHDPGSFDEGLVGDEESIAAVEVEPIVQADPEVLKAIDTAWVAYSLGPNWRTMLDVQADDTVRTLAEKMYAIVPSKKYKEVEPYIQRYEMRLQGLSNVRIGEAQDMPAGTINTFFYNGRIRLETALREASNNSSEETDVTDDTPEVEEPVALVEKKKEPEVPPQDRYALELQERLGLDSTALAGLRGFLDPKNHGEMTPVRQKAGETVRDYLRPLLDDISFDLSAQEKKWVRASFGVFVSQGDPVDGRLQSVYDLTGEARRKNPAAAHEVADNIFSGLEKLLFTGQSAEIETLKNSDFIRAAIHPSEISSERFEELKGELNAHLARVLGGDDADIISDAINEGIMPGYNFSTDKTKRDVFSKVRQQVLVRGESRTGWPKIDEALRYFLTGSKFAAGVSQAQSQTTTDTEAQTQRYVTAGLYVHYHKLEKAAA